MTLTTDRSRRTPARLLLLAALPFSASLLVLTLARVPGVVWAQQLSAVAIAAVVAMLVGRRVGPEPAWDAARVMAVVTVAGLAWPLVTAWPGPRRWLLLGPVRLYVAALLLPAFVQAWALLARGDARSRVFAATTAVVASLVLAAQPDASQVLALLAGMVATAPRGRGRRGPALVTSTAVAAIAAWTFTRPDPLQPVPHVEGVVALAFSHAWWAGVGVAGSAVALVAGLWRASLRGAAAYHATLFVCALAGLTPAPLVGYGAGPWIGYGLMAGLAPRAAGRCYDDGPRQSEG